MARVPPPLIAFAVGLGVVGVAVLVHQVLDLDGDGLTTREERALGTSDRWADTDGDTLSDGWEASRGLSPTGADTDGDGLDDGFEVRAGLDPRSADTDGDGLPDGVEARGGVLVDCDGDGVPAARESDDDNDQRPDAQEEEAHRCNPDVDGDGVLDGLEGNIACVTRPDCDGDGVRDLDEINASFDPLDPDTYGVHLPDAIPYAFQLQGQAPGADGDHDGIPDPWEASGGLFDWGGFVPKPGQRDLLVEFARVTGPAGEGSARFLDVSLRPAYERVAAAFAEEGITLQWVETHVALPAEPLGASVPSRSASHYRAVLDQTLHALNPFVLTVVINPQQDQSEVLHAGVATLRGSLAAVDLSQFVKFRLEDEHGSRVDSVSPYAEAIIHAGKQALLSRPAGALPDGTYFLRFEDGTELRWTPWWLRNPRLVPTSGPASNLFFTQRTLEADALAHTLIHEIGHSLGLCHPHEDACRTRLPAAEQNRIGETSMSYSSPDTLVAYLPSEWDRVRSYLTCPPPTPVRLLAEGASRDARLDAKYAYELATSEEPGRACGVFTALPRDLAPAANATRYDAPAERAPPATAVNDGTATTVYWGASATGAIVVGAVLTARLPRPPRPPSAAPPPDSYTTQPDPIGTLPDPPESESISPPRDSNGPP